MRSLNLAHRGFSGKYPENTMIAFKQAYLAGADGVELDVQLTRDGEVVIFHDETIDRMTDGSGTLTELTSDDIGSFKIDCPLQNGLQRQSIPTLEEYLRWVQGKAFVTNIELKTKTSEDIGLERRVLDLIFAYGVADTIIISSFHRANMARIKKQSPTIQTGLLVPGCNEHIIHTTKQLGMDYIHPHALSLNEVMISCADDFGLGINTWTINEIEDLKRIDIPGINAVITDYPDRLKKVQSSKIKVV